MTTTPQLRPWQRTLRTVFQALIALAVMVPLLVSQAGLDSDRWPWLAGVLAVAAIITRIMATPAVEAFLQRFLPWLSAAGGKQGGQAGQATVDYLLGLALVMLIGAMTGMLLVHFLLT